MTHPLSLLLLALPQQPQPAVPLAFVGVNVLAMKEEAVLTDQTVLVEGGKVARIGPRASIPVKEGIQRIQGQGRFLIPGLCDAHVHVMDEGDLLVYLANGVTTVRNLKGLPWHLELRERIARGEVLGPHFLTAGPFVNEPQVKTVEDAELAVGEQVEAGYDMLKIHGELALATYEALLAEAARAGIPVIGHVPRNLPIEAVLERKGQVEIAHAEEYLYTFFDRRSGPVTAELVEGIAKKTAAAGVTVTPNLVAFHSIVRQIEDLERELARPEMAWVAPGFARTWQKDLNRYERTFEPSDAPEMGARYSLLERFTQALQAAGVRLLAGSDAMNPACVPGFSLQVELELLVRAGLSPYQALRAATANSGEFLGDGSGLVAEGAPADLVLLAANPLEDIARTRAIEGVVLRGRWLPKEELQSGMKTRAAEYERERGFMSRMSPGSLDACLAYRLSEREKDPRAVLYRSEGIESLSLGLASIGNLSAARQAAELAVEDYPARWTAWVRLAEACAALEDAAAARVALEKALALRPGDARIQDQLEALETR
jgi:cytosine/adenosine deaminase-related metal-dependent hydrolase